MIPLSEINNAAAKFKIPVDTIEKDYVISWILLSLAKNKLSNDLIFYGGTAIRRIYFEDHRYSEDIDLQSPNLFSLKQLQEALSEILENVYNQSNIRTEFKHHEIIAEKHRIQIPIHYSGYEEIAGSAKIILIDFSMKTDFYGEKEKHGVLTSYSDIKNHTETLSVMTLNSILANKLGMLIDNTRNEPRDLFDIWFLLNKIHQYNFNLEAVRKTFKVRCGFFPTHSLLRPYIETASLKTNWKLRLEHQVASLPDIDIVINEINKKLETLL